MLSILIPIYNFKVVDVVLELKAQAEKLDVPFEILCFDDASSNSTKTLTAHSKQKQIFSTENLTVTSEEQKFATF